LKTGIPNVALEIYGANLSAKKAFKCKKMVTTFLKTTKRAMLPAQLIFVKWESTLAYPIL